MESFKIENLTFTYPNNNTPALSDINLSVSQGEFITICGMSGCGKTTLLRLLKTSLAPFGNIKGDIYFEGKKLTKIHTKTQTSKIGFVMQSPDNQIVTDKVWHELAFGLESLGYSTPEIRTRVAEMASFFGIQTWFHKKVTELSGGQKQLLNLASVMVMQPSVLILDEPTSQLDPIAAQEFLKTLEKINHELSTTIILTEHRLEDAFPISDRVIAMDNGRIIADELPKKLCKILKETEHPMYSALPTPMRIYGAVENNFEYPLTVREGKDWLQKYSVNHQINSKNTNPKANNNSKDIAIKLTDVWFKYEKELPDVIKGLNLEIYKEETFAITGGNGTGKTTALSIISGLYEPYRGKVLINGKKPSETKNLYNGLLGVLPQNPQSLFVKKTVYLDLMDILSDRKITKTEKDEQIKNTALLCRIENLLESHPYDLSGGEQQRTALAKILLQRPEILLLDEPTKGMDAHFKEIFAEILENLKANGVTIVMVSHDIEFCAEYADRCAMFFGGNITSTGVPREFFAGKSFYTTSTNRMARSILPNAVLANDVILACGREVKKKKQKTPLRIMLTPKENIEDIPKPNIQKLTPKRIIFGCIFAILFILTCIFGSNFYTDWRKYTVQLITIIEMVCCLTAFLPKRNLDIEIIQQPQNNRNLTKRTLAATILILLVIPLTIYIGIFYFGDKKYYFISLLIILETLIPFCMIFEQRKPQARELIIISVMCAVAVAGRTAFFMLPQFKPVVALVIIAGVCFGGETGFLVGVITGFVSNFFFGQGPWTPWQMFAFGIIGFIAGILYKKGLLRKSKTSLCIFGAFATFVIYGGIMNPASVIISHTNLSADMVIAAYLVGIPVDLIHAASTSFFLWFISEPMIDKLERIKTKYGLIER